MTARRHPPTDRGSILILGDAQLARGLMRTVLTKVGYEVTCAADVKSGFDLLADRDADLLMVALKLSDGGGVEAVERVRRRRGPERNLPVIVFGNAWDQNAVRRDCRRAGAQAYLEKPISVSRLLTSIRALLSLSPARHGLHRLGGIMSAPVDLARLADISDGDMQLEREFATLFASVARGAVDELTAALGDPDAWSRAAHKLKGASANIGATVVAELAAAAEKAQPSPELLARLSESARDAVGFLSRRHPALPWEDAVPL